MEMNDDMNDDTIILPNMTEYTVKYWPVFTISIFIITWAFFIWGIWIIGLDNYPFGMKEYTKASISPPQSTFPFITVNEWPSCTSARSNSWRLVSSQFVHAGIEHIVGNTLITLYYGSMLECTHPYNSFITILIYEMACIFGCLGHSYIMPFIGSIGSSNGVYGLAGGSISHLILNRDILSDWIYYTLLSSLLIHSIYDLVMYFGLYNANVGYAGHCSSFFIGIFLGLSFGLTKKQKWKKVLGALGLAAFLTMSISLIVHYTESWPPQSLSYNPTFYKYNRTPTCCSELYRVINSTFSLEQARDAYECDYRTIYKK